MIRAIIFFVAGILPILFPRQVNSFQNFVLRALHTRYRIRYEKRYYYNIGIIFIVISVVLFVISIII